MKTYYFIIEIIKTNKLLGGNYPIVPFTKYNQYDIIHFHDTRTMYLRRHELKNYTGKVVLQSHSPQPLGHELYNVIPASVRFFVPFIRGRFEKMDKYAFERADYIVFPCEDAEEPYFNDWPYYKLKPKKRIIDIFLLEYLRVALNEIKKKFAQSYPFQYLTLL